MAEQICKILTCDRCGKTLTLHANSSVQHGKGAKDGVHSIVDSFEATPKDWKTFSDISMLLCPECTSEYGSLVDAFKTNGVVHNDNENS